VKQARVYSVVDARFAGDQEVVAMSRSSKRVLLVLALAAAAPVPGTTSSMLAHHGGGVEYFMDRTLGPVTGVVTNFAFTFPHPFIEFDVKDEKGNIQKWAAVFQPTPTRLRAAGWTRDSVKPGDTLALTYSPHKTAEHVGFARRIEVNGKFLDQGD
jgi:hypothetical protein